MEIREKNNDFMWAMFTTIVGLFLILHYIFLASMDVPTSDYIRIINNYLDNVYDIKKFLVPDLVARVPITYLFRIINVTFFKYSIQFDRVVGAVALSIFNFLIIMHTRKMLHINLLKNITTIVLSIIIFSLMSWEMLLNGTGYAIFIFFDFVLVIYELYDKLKYCNNCIECANRKKHCKINNIILIILIIFTCTCLGSDYQVALMGTIIFFSLLYIIFNSKYKKNEKKGLMALIHNRHIFLIFVSIVCFAIYYISNHVGYAGDYTYVGMENISIFEVITKNLSYCYNFIVKSFASIIIGVETFEYALVLESIKEIHIVLVGSFFIFIIFVAIIFIFIKRLYKKDLFSIMLMFHGLVSVGLVFLARYAFMNDHYGMSSRYAVQFMLLPVGITMVLANVIDIVFCVEKNEISKNKNIILSEYSIIKDIDYLDEKNYINEETKKISFDKRKIIYILLISIMVFFMSYGRVLTTIDEINKNRARRFCYESAYNLARNIDDYKESKDNDEFLMNVFEYHRGANLIRQAFDTLKKNKLNIYSKE